MNYLTVSEFAKKWNVSRQTIHQMIRRGEIEAKRVDGMYFVDEESDVPQHWRSGHVGRWAAQKEKLRSEGKYND